MCGICGLWSFEPFRQPEKVKTLLFQMLKDIEVRGGDATGVALVNTHTGDICVIKQPMGAKQFVKTFRDIDVTGFNLILGHTRFATQGDEKQNVNNHPHYSKLHENVLIHNGIISNYDDVKERCAPQLDGDCDSEIILGLYNRRNGTIRKTLKELSGIFALALYDKSKLYLYRDRNPLYTAYNHSKKLFMFSSHQDVLTDVFRSQRSVQHRVFVRETVSDELFYRPLKNEHLMTVDFAKRRVSLSRTETKPYFTTYDYRFHSPSLYGRDVQTYLDSYSGADDWCDRGV